MIIFNYAAMLALRQAVIYINYMGKIKSKLYHAANVRGYAHQSELVKAMKEADLPLDKNTISRMWGDRANGYSDKTLAKLCAFLSCHVYDLLEYVDE